MVAPISPLRPHPHHFSMVETTAQDATLETDLSDSIYGKVQSLSTTLYSLKDQVLTYDYLKTKAKQIIITKANPWKKPPGTSGQLKKIQQKLTTFNSMKKKIQDSKERVETRLNQLSKSSNITKKQQLELNKEKNQLALLEERLSKVNEVIASLKKNLRYIHEDKNTQVFSRFTGYIGTASNALIPGSSKLTSLLLSSGAIARRLMLMNNLPAEERDNLKKSVLIGTAQSVSVLAASYLIMPYVNQALFDSVVFFNPALGELGK